MAAINFGIVGGGWRSEFFLRVARSCPDRFNVAGMVVRNADKGAAIESEWGVPTYRSVDALLDAVDLGDDGFVITSIPRDVNPNIIVDLASRGVGVLSETPPANDVDDMVRLYEAVGEHSGCVQVAEQYHLQPLHAARLALCASGKLGTISQAQVSAAHGYHGISLIRRALGIKGEACNVRGFGFSTPNVQGADRNGPPTQEKIAGAWQEVFHFDFGDRQGVYDFNYEQYFSYVRNERVCIRGERGEIINHTAVWLADYRTPIEQRFVRHDAGAEGNLEGYHHKGIQCGDAWLYRNPYAPASMTDDEIAVAACLDRMADAVRTGEDFYSLAEASQDHYLGLMGAKAVETATVVEAPEQVWANDI